MHPRIMFHLAPHSTLNTSTSSLPSTSPVLLSSYSANPDLLSTCPTIHWEDSRQDGTSTEFHSSTLSQSKGLAQQQYALRNVRQTAQRLVERGLHISSQKFVHAEGLTTLELNVLLHCLLQDVPSRALLSHHLPSLFYNLMRETADDLLRLLTNTRPTTTARSMCRAGSAL